jgi:hypothetical protein
VRLAEAEATLRNLIHQSMPATFFHLLGSRWVRTVCASICSVAHQGISWQNNSNIRLLGIEEYGFLVALQQSSAQEKYITHFPNSFGVH